MPFLGSSPLARGLLSKLLENVRDQGIIPARAGFTKRSFIIISSLQDHPRSRGVYTSRQVDCDGIYGSSPLARGLLFCGF